MRSENKADWGPGPWQNEPDKVEWVDEATGLHCRILRGLVGSFCGYVGVPEEHPAWGMLYDHYVYVENEGVEWWRRHVTQRVQYKINDIQVHGGLTYANEHVDDDLWWFGFDCSHTYDYMPGMTKYVLESAQGDTYRDLAYVTVQVLSLAQQLAAIKKEPHAEEKTG